MLFVVAAVGYEYNETEFDPAVREAAGARPVKTA